VKGKALHAGLPTSTSRPLYTRMCASQNSGSHGHCPCDRAFFFRRQTISVHPSLGGRGLDSKEKPTVKTALTVATRFGVTSAPCQPVSRSRAQLAPLRGCRHHLRPQVNQHAGREAAESFVNGRIRPRYILISGKDRLLRLMSPGIDRHHGRPLVGIAVSGLRSLRKTTRRDGATAPRSCGLGLFL
jgi:hypothetical protein